MASPHVSGCIAAFLSLRREFQTRPERVKEIFLANATDLGRERYFQGHGLVDDAELSKRSRHEGTRMTGRVLLESTLLTTFASLLPTASASRRHP